jgi:hypothetical protein
MAIEIQKVQLKRADSTAIVSAASLDRGEPAIAFANRELWVGDGTGNVKISDLIIVANHASLPGTGNSTKLYLVLTDETLGNESSLYAFKGGSYVLVTCGTADLASTDITDFVSAVNTVINDRRGANDGVAPLDTGGTIPSTYLPDLAITDVHVVADNSERDALSVQAGDVAINTGNNTTYMYTGTAWQEMLTAPDGISTINGQSGPVVTLDTGDIAEGGNLYFTTARAVAAVIDDAAAINATDKAWSVNKTNLEIADAKTYLGGVQIDDSNIGDGRSVVYNSTSGNLEYHAITINGGELT